MINIVEWSLAIIAGTIIGIVAGFALLYIVGETVEAFI